MNAELALQGAPRRNGEVVFDEPWQSRAFGIAVALTERHNLAWDDFRRHLIAAVDAGPDRPYWESWLVALEAWLQSSWPQLGTALAGDAPTASAVDTKARHA